MGGGLVNKKGRRYSRGRRTSPPKFFLQASPSNSNAWTRHFSSLRQVGVALPGAARVPDPHPDVAAFENCAAEVSPCEKPATSSFSRPSFQKPSSRVMGNVYVNSRIKAASSGAFLLCSILLSFVETAYRHLQRSNSLRFCAIFKIANLISRTFLGIQAFRRSD